MDATKQGNKMTGIELLANEIASLNTQALDDLADQLLRQYKTRAEAFEFSLWTARMDMNTPAESVDFG
jgi:hypothetical protein